MSEPGLKAHITRKHGRITKPRKESRPVISPSSPLNSSFRSDGSYSFINSTPKKRSKNTNSNNEGNLMGSGIGNSEQKQVDEQVMTASGSESQRYPKRTSTSTNPQTFVAAIDRDDQLWNFDPTSSSLTCKKGPWHYEFNTWSRFPAEGSGEVIQDSASQLLLTTQGDGTVLLETDIKVDVQHWVSSLVVSLYYLDKQFLFPKVRNLFCLEILSR